MDTIIKRRGFTSCCSSGDVDPVLLCNNSVCSLLIHRCTVWISQQTEKEQTTTDSQDCRRTIAPDLPSIHDLYKARAKKLADNITADPSQPGHNLFTTLPSGRRYRALYTKTSRHLCSFFPQDISLTNT